MKLLPSIHFFGTMQKNLSTIIIYDYEHFLCAYILLLNSITLIIMKAFKALGAYMRWV